MFTSSSADYIYNGEGHIPSTNQSNWQIAGLLNDAPKHATFVIDISTYSGNDDSKITQALSQARTEVGNGCIARNNTNIATI
jgi:hypothetical protein